MNIGTRQWRPCGNEINVSMNSGNLLPPCPSGTPLNTFSVSISCRGAFMGKNSIEKL